MPKLIHLDREKYFAIAQAEGVSAALTRLHLDLEKMEFETFEGEKGYQPLMFRELDEVRMFSRELWQVALDKPGA